MPCYDLHIWFGNTLLERLNGTSCAPPAGDVARAAFTAGLVGPDPFFFDLVPPPLFRPAEKRTGNALHDRASDEVYLTLFRAARARAAKEPQYAGAVISYALGFLCHYALDSTMHPLICSLYGGLDHTRFESALGGVLLKRMGLTSPLGKVTKLLPAAPLKARPDRQASSPLDAIDAVLAETAYTLFGRNVRGVYEKSFFKFRRFHAFLYDPSGKRYAFVRYIERFLRLKENCLSGFLFCPPPEGDRPGRLFETANRESETFYALTYKALDRAEDLFRPAVPALTATDEREAENALNDLVRLLAGSTMSYGME